MGIAYYYLSNYIHKQCNGFAGVLFLYDEFAELVQKYSKLLRCVLCSSIYMTIYTLSQHVLGDCRLSED